MNMVHIITLVLIATVSACATEPKTTVWRDEELRQRQFGRVLVIGAFPTEEQRMKIEEEFVQQFNNRNIGALASNPYLPYDQMLRTEIIDTVSREQGADAVLVIRLLDKKKLRTYYPGGVYPLMVKPDNMDSKKILFYSDVNYYNVNKPGYTMTKEYVVLEAGLYEAENEQIVWRASTTMRVDLNFERAVSDIAHEMAKTISQEKLFR